VKLAIKPHLLANLRMHVAVTPLPHTPKWLAQGRLYLSSLPRHVLLTKEEQMCTESRDGSMILKMQFRDINISAYNRPRRPRGTVDV
jgi:hypothetical protein